jgi:hypothetical protein
LRWSAASTSKADQIWIDTLRGKYANLPVDKVIAVARAGFAKTARAAAEKARIQTLTLEEATSANWHLIAELPDAALVVAHFPVAENVSLHLVNGPGAHTRHDDFSAPMIT